MSTTIWTIVVLFPFSDAPEQTKMNLQGVITNETNNQMLAKRLHAQT